MGRLAGSLSRLPLFIKSLMVALLLTGACLTYTTYADSGYTVSGVAEVGGVVLPDATISYSGTNGSAHTTTDSEGNYTFTNVPNGSYSLFIDSNSSATAPHVDATSDNAGLVVNGANVTQNLYFNGATIAVTVKDSEGALASGAKVSADVASSGTFTDSSGDFTFPLSEYAVVGNATTNSSGVAEVPAVAGIEYQICATLSGSSGQQCQTETVSSNTSTEIDFPDSYTVSGLVEVNGIAESGATITYSGANGGGTTTTASNGSYTIPNVPNGNYSVFIDSTGNSVVPHIDVTSSNAGLTVNGANVTQNLYFNGATVSVTVQNSDGSLASGASVTANDVANSSTFTDSSGDFTFHANNYSVIGSGSTSGSGTVNVPVVSGIEYDVCATYTGGTQLCAAPATITGNTNITIEPLPGTPTNLTAQSPTNQPPVLSWTGVSGATYYNVYRNGALIDTISASNTTYADSNALAGANSYYVTAVNAEGQGSASDTISVLYDSNVVNVSGELSANQEWTAGNEYVVDGSVEIPNGVTLTIDPGVIIEFSGEYSTGILVDSGGTVSANGTAASHIIFTSPNDGTSTAPAAGDYDSAFTMNGGTASVAYANFKYGSYEVNEQYNNGQPATNAALSITNSSFSNIDGEAVVQNDDASLALSGNTFIGSNAYSPIVVASDPDLTGIALAGSGANTFTGSGVIAVSATDSTMPSGETWEVSNGGNPLQLNISGSGVEGTLNVDSGVELLTSDNPDVGAIQVNGTVNLQSGVVVKASSGREFTVNSGGTLNVAGTAANPDTFTSVNDDSVGGTVPGSSGSPAAGDYYSAVTLLGGTVTVTHANFEYTDYAIGYATNSNQQVVDGANVTVTDSSFSNTPDGAVVQNGNSILSLAGNTFNVGETSDDVPISVTDDADLSGIVLAGSNANTFTGSGLPVAISATDSTVPSGASWEVSSSSGTLQLNLTSDSVVGVLDMDNGTELLAASNANDAAVQVNGTVNLQSGVAVKTSGSGYAFMVNTGGTLDVTGTATNPDTFTSINDNSVDGAEPGSSGSPTAGSYGSAISMNGGTASISHANFTYAATDINDQGSIQTISTGYLGAADSDLAVTNSSFTNSQQGVTQNDDTSLSLAGNTFNLGTPTTGGFAVSSDGDADLSSISLSGSNANTFTGSGPNVVVEANGNVPAGSTWTVDNSGGEILYVNDSTITNGVDGIDVDGTVNIDPGVVIKVGNYGFDVQSDGVLNAIGGTTSSHSTPIVFTSFNDSTLGGASDGNSSSTGAAGNYTTALRFEQPSSSDVVNYVDFKDASSALSLGTTGTLSVSNSQFADNTAAFVADTTSTENPVLGSLASSCLYPYANEIDLSNTWFGTSGYPGFTTDYGSYAGLSLPDGYPGLSEEYSYFTSVYNANANVGDNTIPWTLFSCSVPTDPPVGVAFPVTPVNTVDLLNGGIASGKLWTGNYGE